MRPSEVRLQPLLRTLTERAEKYGVSLTGLGINDEVPVAPPVPSRLQLDRPRSQHIPKDVHVVWSDDEEDQTLVPPILNCVYHHLHLICLIFYVYNIRL